MLPLLQWTAFLMIGIGLYLILKGLTEKGPIVSEQFGEEFEKYYKSEEEEGLGKIKNRHFETEGRSKVCGGGVVLIGPIPIVFGDSKYATYALVLAITLMLLSMLFILMR